MESAGSSSSENHHYTMENGGAATTAMTAQHRAIPVSSPGLLELIKKMNSQPLFQDVNYLFNYHLDPDSSQQIPFGQEGSTQDE